MSSSSEISIIFVSFDEPNADENFERLRLLHPSVKRLQGVVGIGQAYQQAADLSETDYFYFIDADNWVLDSFQPARHINAMTPDISIWRSRNAVNGLEWYNGGIKLLSKRAVYSIDRNAVDFFLSLQGSRAAFGPVYSENRFNYSPFQAWRTAFRECAKLSSQSIKTPDSTRILNVWCNVGRNSLNGTWCILGARMGSKFGEANRGLPTMSQINNRHWLDLQFQSVLTRIQPRQEP